MQRRHFLSLATVSLLAFVSGSQAQPQTAAPRTVVDYFRLLPDKYFEIGAKDRAAFLKDKGRTTIDLKNDYIFMSGDGAQGPLWVIVFRHAGRALIAVLAPGGDGPEQDAQLDFYRYEQGRWQNVTRAVSPVPYNPRYQYELPRYGTTIHIKDRQGRPVLDWVWKDGTFTSRLP